MTYNMSSNDYIIFLRERITNLLSAKKMSEYKLSYALGKNKGYINKITSGKSTPSLKEFLNICECLDIEPTDFFNPEIDLNDLSSRYDTIEKIKQLNAEDYILIAAQIDRYLKS